MARFFAKVGYRMLGDDGLFSAVAKELEIEGFCLLGAHELLDSETTVPEGPLGRLKPNEEAEADIGRGIAIARALGALDIGQAVVVQQGLVLGVEAIEGTDALLARCATLKREGPGGVLVKISKPRQDRRADLPTIGAGTVAAAAAAGLRGIAIEAGSTLLLDRAAIVAAADARKIFVVGIAAQ
jgi:hypothetical protein